MKPKNTTRDKLDEAVYFFQQLEVVFQDDDKFRWNLSAFLIAYRSITLYMQKQYYGVSGFDTWYEEQRKLMEADKELKFMNKVRVESVHTEPVDLGATRRMEFTMNAFIGGKDDVKPPSILVPDFPDKTSTSRRWFVDNREVDIRDYLSRQIGKIKRIVDECEQRFLAGP